MVEDSTTDARHSSFRTKRRGLALVERPKSANPLFVIDEWCSRI